MKYVLCAVVALAISLPSFAGMILEESVTPNEWKYDARTNTPNSRWYLVGGETTPELPKTITLNGVNFDTNASSLQASAYPILVSNVAVLKMNPYVNVEIAGYTDAQGSEVYNQLLSEARAKTVYNYFVSQGVSADRLSYKGYGEMNPVDSNDTVSGRAANRRIELSFNQ